MEINKQVTKKSEHLNKRKLTYPDQFYLFLYENRENREFKLLGHTG